MRSIEGGATQGGAFILMPDAGPGTAAVVILGGSEGGDQTARRLGAAMLEEGLTVLGVPYYGGPGASSVQGGNVLPADFAGLPVERVVDAVRWLHAMTGIDPARVALYGFSKGAELALLVATLAGPCAAVVAVAPSDVVWEGWGRGVVPAARSGFSWQGRALPFVPYEGFAEEMGRYARGDPQARLATAHEQGRVRHPQRVTQARIRVEQCRSPVLLIAGSKDLAWPSAAMARSIAQQRHQAGLPTELHVYADCGHVLCGRGDWRHPTSPTGVQDQRARTQAWALTLRFLHRHCHGRQYETGRRQDGEAAPAWPGS